MGLNTIAAAVAGAVIKAANHNAIRTALTEDFVARTAAGVVSSEAGSLGSSTYRWLNLYATKLFVGSNNIEISVDNSELIFKIGSTEYARITTSHLLPPGLILAHSIASNIGTAGRYQFLYCNGQAVSRTDYARLYANIGDRYGSGDTSTTFNVPDFRGLILRGQDNARGVDPDAASRTAMNTGGATGDNIGSVQAAGTKSPTTPFTASAASNGAHTHLISALYRTASNLSGTNTNLPADTVGGVAYYTDSDGAHTHTITVSGGGDTETRMRNAYAAYIIKT